MLVRDGDALIVVDPGMVARRSLILDPLAELGVTPDAVTHVFLSHHHPDHTMNFALFPNAEVVDFWARYKDDLWLDMPATAIGWADGPAVADAGSHRRRHSLIVEADDAVYAMTHLWWHADRTRSSIRLRRTRPRSMAGRARVLGVADVVIPGHGGPFRVER